MSLILSSWLNDDVKLSRKVSPTELDSAFRTGYLLGELLYKAGVINDFAAVYTPLDGPDACIRNFTALERTLRDKLGVKLSSNDAMDLIKAKPGCAANLLLALRTALVTQRAPVVAPSKSPALLRGSSTSIVSGSPDTVPGGRSLVIKFDSDARRKFSEKDHEFFAEMLKSKLKRTDGMPMKPKSAENSPASKALESPTSKLVARRFLHPSTNDKSSPKNSTLKTRRSSVDPSSEEVVRSIQGVAPAVEPPQKVNESADLEATRARQIELEQRRRKAAAKNVESRIATFEKAIGDISPAPLEHGGSVEFAPIDDAKEIRKFMTVRAHLEPASHIKILKSQVLSDKGRKQENQEYLESLRIRKREEEAARRDRELRRRQEIIAQKQDMDKTQEQKIDEVVLARLMRQSKQERRIAEQLMQVRREKEVMRENRVFREMQYAQQRYRDNEMENGREAELARCAKEEYETLAAIQMQQHREILSRRTLEKRKKHTEFCSHLVWQFVELATKISEYRMLNDGKDVPIKVVREWKTLFLNGHPLEPKYELKLEKDAANNLSDVVQQMCPPLQASQVGNVLDTRRQQDIVHGIELLDSTEFNDYLNASGDWAGPGESELGVKKNELLAALVDNILALSQPPASTEMSKARNVRLRLCILGRRYSGQRTLSARLAAAYGLQVLIIEDIVKDAIETFKSKSGSSSRPVTPGITLTDRLPSLAELGKKLEMSMLEGSKPDDTVVAGVIALAIKACEEQGRGWVICNFPKSRNEAQLLERYLSGYDEPKPVKPGSLKRGEKGASSANNGAQSKPIVSELRRSLIAPVTNSVNDPPPKPPCSALDAVFLLNIDNNVAIRRAAGRRVDPVTGTIYHLEFNLPPSEQYGILDRLVTLPDSANETAQIQNQLAIFEEEELGLIDWFNKFQNLHVVDGNQLPAEVLQNVQSTLHAVVERIDREAKSSKPVAVPSETPSLVPPAKENEVGAIQLQVQPTITPPPAVSPTAPQLEDPPAEVPRPKTPRRDSRSAASRPPSPGKEGKSARAVSPPKESRVAPPPSQGANGLIETQPPLLPTPTLLMPPSVPPTLLRSAGVDGKRIPSKDLIETLSDQWTIIETTYTDEIKFILRSLRREREFILRHFYEQKVAFKRFLERPDRRQAVVDLFQKEFNEIEGDLRYDNDVKAELHQRVEELKEKLWDLSDMRREEADAERLAIIEDRWVEDHMLILTNCYIAAVQAEVERYVGTRQIVLDYYRDAYSALLLDYEKFQVRIPIATARHAPPAEMTLSAYDLHRTTSSHRRAETAFDPPKQGTIVTPSKPAIKASTPAATTTAVKDIKRGPAPTARSTPAVPTYAETEATMLVDLQKAADAATSIPVPNADTLAGGKKDGHVGRRAETANAEDKISAEYDPEIPSECLKTLELEDQLYRWRVERLKQRAFNDIKELRAKSVDAFAALTEWTNQRFQAELDGVRDISVYIREAIESESKLPVALVLEGPRFTIEKDVLTFEPEPEPRPGSPVERRSPDQFAIAQIAGLAIKFRAIAPSGTIPIKDFIGALEHTALTDRTSLPENLGNPTLQEQIANSLDFFDTGFVSWRRFLITATNILPVVGDESLVNLARRYRSCSSYRDGKIEQNDFMLIPLWFENRSEINARKFNRPAKLKRALCVIFGDGQLQTETPMGLEVSVEESDESIVVITPNRDTTAESAQNDGIASDERAATVDVLEFLLYCCSDFSPKDGLMKAIGVMSTLTDATVEDFFKVFHLGVTRLPMSQRVADADVVGDPYPKALLRRIVESMSREDDVYDAFAKSARGIENPASVLACCLYELADVVLVATKSRPSTGVDKLQQPHSAAGL
ncbi:adenylate kinase [Synchytrium endobioticum]|uniref:Adenylate kinase n=1 Tax=Synchytrium endobioticum TaxID=286115 RepID=A0A507DIA9_9FUNG|nr:adenylate kinase [Synchytrium endobioticum]